MKNITYLFGAGASYNAIPIVGELDNAFSLLKNWNDEAIRNPKNISLNSEHINGHRIINSQLSTAELNSRIYGTIDTFAKKLTLTNDITDLNKLKAALSFFFTSWQEIIIDSAPSVRKNAKFKEIESRYLGLLANYLIRKERVEIPDNINFLTWNYDTQLERALALILDKDLDYVLNNYSIHPIDKSENSKIVHLNGIAGLFNKDKEVISMNNEKSPLGNNDKNTILCKLFPIINSVEKGIIDFSKHFTFAWENSEISNKAIEKAQRILMNTDVLVVVGYSFPNFNNEIDSKLFNTLKSSGRDYKIYYQDLNANKNIIYQRFRIPQNKIETDNENLNQFIIPQINLSQ